MTHNSLQLLVGALLAAAPVVAQDIGVTFSNNVNTALEAPYSPWLVPQSGITVEAWVTYNDAVATGLYRFPTIVRQNVSNGNESYLLRVNANNTADRVLRWKVATTGGDVTVDWTFASGQLLAWTHVAATYDGASANLFVNGTLVGSAAGTGAPIRDLGGVFRIGKGDNSTGPYEVWNGDIDEVRVWPFARTPAEIAATMNQKLFFVPGFVETWNFDSTLIDSSSAMTLSASGTVPFNFNALALGVPVSPQPIGASTPGCGGAMRLSPTVPAMANTPFGAKCVRTTPNFPGIWAATFGVLPFGVNVFGFDLWVDPTVLIQIPATANGLGVMAFDYTLSGMEPPGFVFALQAIVLDACAPQQLAASDAMLITVQ